MFARTKTALMMLALGVSLTGCSSIWSVKETPRLSPPDSCIALCRSIPENVSDPSWRRVMVEQYVECAVLHNQCRKALVQESLE